MTLPRANLKPVFDLIRGFPRYDMTLEERQYVLKTAGNDVTYNRALQNWGNLLLSSSRPTEVPLAVAPDGKTHTQCQIDGMRKWSAYLMALKHERTNSRGIGATAKKHEHQTSNAGGQGSAFGVSVVRVET